MSCWETPPYNFQPTNSCIVFRAASLCCFRDRARDGCSFLSILVMMNAQPNQDFIHGFREGTISISSGTVSCVLSGCSIHFCTVLDSFLHLPLQKNITPCQALPMFWELRRLGIEIHSFLEEAYACVHGVGGAPQALCGELCSPLCVTRVVAGGFP